jgi:hypothetical protein
MIKYKILNTVIMLAIFESTIIVLNYHIVIVFNKKSVQQSFRQLQTIDNDIN